MNNKEFKKSKNPLDLLKQMTEVIEREHKDIAPEEKEFSNLTFAIANSCGEAGREFYKRICANWSNGVNDPKLLEQRYDYALKSGRSGNGISTVYYLFKQAGLTLPDATDTTDATGHILNKNSKEMKEQEIMQDVECEEIPMMELPHFDQDYEWPWPLNEFLQEAESCEEHDLLLLGGFTVIGSTLGKKVSTIYGKKRCYPSLNLIVTATSGQGKGKLLPLKHFLYPIHQEVRQMSTNIPRMFIIAGNNTSAGLYKNIVANDGIGIIFESEADTLNASLKGQYGNFSDVLRKAFDHERLTYNRKLDNIYEESEPMALSLLISGTPVQIKNLVNNTENGLFNRIIYYYAQGKEEWINNFINDNGETTNDKFYRIGDNWKDVYTALQGMEQVNFELTEKQIEIFNNTMASLKAEAINIGDDVISSYVNRLAITLLRLMTIVAFLREHKEILETAIIGEIDLNPTIRLDDADFFAVISMAGVINTHAKRIKSFLPQTSITYNGSPERDKLLSQMSKIFSRKQWLATADTMNIKEKTAQKWLERLLKRNAIKRIAEGMYQKL